MIFNQTGIKEIRNYPILGHEKDVNHMYTYLHANLCVSQLEGHGPLDYLSQWNVLSQYLIKFDIEKG